MNAVVNAERTVFDADCEAVSSTLAKREVYAKVSLTMDHASLRATGGAKNFVTFKNGIIYVNGTPYLDASGARRREGYNVRNFMLTVAVCMEECNTDAITEAIISFPGLPHRAEEFFTANGVRFIDSSIDSSPERPLKTLSALGERPIVIIGGLGKGLSLKALADELPRLTRGAVLTGAVGRELSEILATRSEPYACVSAQDLTEAVKVGYDMAKPSGTVILSPAATSFDRYKNFSERGNAFKSIVLSLFS